jgi:hypothetical protein
LYERGRYQITGNKVGKYSNSQFAMLFQLPREDQVAAKQPIELLVAPPGSRYIPDAEDTEDNLLALGWKHQKVHKCQEFIHNIRGGIRAKRCQYELRHHVGSTVHSVMGQTLASLVTRIERPKQSPYSLWLPAQVVVLLSRTRRGRDTIFVSKNKKETAGIIFGVLKQMTPFRAYLSHIVRNLCNTTSGIAADSAQPAVIDQGQSIYRPRDVSFPHDDTGYVYILVSVKDPKFTYIGSTKNVVRRLSQHNSGFGADQTAPVSLRPWGLLAYVAGFDGIRANYLRFENRWIAAKETYSRNRQVSFTVEGTVRLAEDLIAEFNEQRGLDLRLVHCGTLTRLRNILSSALAENGV